MQHVADEVRTQRSAAIRPIFQRMRNKGIHRGWMLDQLAQRGILVSYQSMWNYETGRQRPSAQFVSSICAVLDIEPDLLHIEVAPPRRRRKSA